MTPCTDDPRTEYDDCHTFTEDGSGETGDVNNKSTINSSTDRSLPSHKEFDSVEESSDHDFETTTMNEDYIPLEETDTNFNIDIRR